MNAIRKKLIGSLRISALAVLALCATPAHSQPLDLTVESFNAEINSRRPNRAYLVEWDLARGLDPEALNGIGKFIKSRATPDAPPVLFTEKTSSITTRGHGVATILRGADYHLQYVSDGLSGDALALDKDAYRMESSFANGQARSLHHRPEGVFGRVAAISRWKSMAPDGPEVRVLIASLLNPLDMIAPTEAYFEMGQHIRPDLTTLRCVVPLTHEGIPGAKVSFYFDPANGYRTLRFEIEYSEIQTIGRSDVIYNEAGAPKTILTAYYDHDQPKGETVTVTINKITPIEMPDPEDLSVVFPAGASIVFPTGATRTATSPEEADLWVKEALRQ